MTALGGTLLAVLIGGTVALVVTLTDIRHRNVYVFCFVMPLLLAAQVVAPRMAAALRAVEPAA